MVLESPVLLSSYARCGQERSFAFAHPVGEGGGCYGGRGAPGPPARWSRRWAKGYTPRALSATRRRPVWIRLLPPIPLVALPLAYFGLFEERLSVAAPSAGLGIYELDEWRPVGVAEGI